MTNEQMTNELMNLRLTIIFFLFTINYQLLTINCFSQGAAINSTGVPADKSAIMDVSGNGKGVLIPRMSTANRPPNPAEALLIYNSSSQCFEAFNANTSQWVNIACIKACLVPAPAEASHLASADMIQWNWNAVSGAADYKWNTTNDYSTATTVSPAGTTTMVQNGLNCNTTYTLYVWALNSCGVSKPAVLTQTTTACAYHCGQDGTFTDARDGQTYGFVKIGSQTWMCQNLNATKYSNGDAILNVTDNTAWVNAYEGAYCNYNNDANNAAIYGRLYHGMTLRDSRKLCPVGWHMPTNDEWTILTDYLGGYMVAGGKMKETGFDHWQDPNIDATNASGFTALSAGFRDFNGKFGGEVVYGYWWSSTVSSYSIWQYMSIYVDAWSGLARSYALDVNIGLSVRCIKD